MLRILRALLFGPSNQPPWFQPRLVRSTDPIYGPLKARLITLDVPEEQRLALGALSVHRDRGTGQHWANIIVEDGPCPLYGLAPCEAPPSPQTSLTEAPTPAPE